MFNNIQTIELKKSKKGTKFLYQAIKDGFVIATRTSSRDYVAALVHQGSKTITNGIGRMDLLNSALKNGGADYIAILKQDF